MLCQPPNFSDNIIQFYFLLMKFTVRTFLVRGAPRVILGSRLLSFPLRPHSTRSLQVCCGAQGAPGEGTQTSATCPEAACTGPALTPLARTSPKTSPSCKGSLHSEFQASYPPRTHMHTHARARTHRHTESLMGTTP